MIEKRKNKTIVLMWMLAIFTILFFSMRVYTRLSGGFSLDEVSLKIPNHLQVSFDQRAAQELFNQSYTYLGKGSQSFVFLSGDEKYVIKLFKKKHLLPSNPLLAFSKIPIVNSFCEKKIDQRKEALTRVVSGYRTGYEKRKEGCGLVYVHLDLSKVAEKPLVLYDKLGTRRLLDLNEIFFVVQKKAIPTKQKLKGLLETGDVALAKKCVWQLLDHYMVEYKEGVYDQDHGILSNKGFIGDKVVLMDAGKLTETKEIQKKEKFLPHLNQNIFRLTSWVENNYPEHTDEILSSIEKWRQS